MKTIFFAALLVTLVGCGGGTFTLNQLENTKGKIPPGPLLDKMQEAVRVGNHAEVTERLKRLTGAAAERFDWAKFWSELSVRPYREQLVASHKTQLLDLHAQDCDSYPAFTRFLLSISTGTEYAVGPERKCNTRIEPTVAVQIARREEAIAQGPDRLDKLERTLTFLKLEVSGAGYSSAWISELQNALPFFDKIGLEAARGGKFVTYLDILVAGEKHGLMDVPLHHLAAEVIVTPVNREQWFTKFGFVEGARRFHHYLGLMPNGLSALTDDEQNALNQRLANEIEGTDAEKLPVVYATAAALSRAVHSQVADTARKLAAFDKLLLAAETNWFSQAEAFRKDRLAYSAKALNGTAASHELMLFAGRTLEASPYWPSSAIVKDEIDTVFFLSQNLATAKTTAEKKAAKKALCDFLESKDVYGQKLTQAQLADELAVSLPAGCHTVERAPVAFRTALNTITASFASLIEANDTDFELLAPAVRLGAVYLQTTDRPANRVPTPTPPSSNAVAVPVLIGLELPEKTVRLKKGSHAFIFHLTLKKAKDGEAEPVDALAGYDGPSLLLDVENAVKAPLFVSVPGPGQAESPARPGGQGDKSTVDFEQVNEWLDALSSLDKLTVVRPLTVHSAVDLDSLDDLLNNATKTPESKIKVFTIPGYVHQLPAAEKAQVIAAAEQHYGRKLKPEDLDDYYKSVLAPMAIQQANSLLDQSTVDGLYLRTEALPEFRAKDVYRVEGGASGPKNLQGPEGKPGKIDVTVTKKP